VLTLRDEFNWPLNSVSFSPDGQRIVSWSEDGTTRVWDGSTGQTLFVLKTPHVYHAQFAPNGQSLLTLDTNTGPRIWDAAGKLRATLPLTAGLSVATAFSADGQQLFTATSDGVFTRWDVQSARTLQSFRASVRVSLRDALSPDQKLLVAVGIDGIARIFDTNTGKEVRALRANSIAPCAANAEPCFTNVIAQFSPDGKWIATTSTDNNVRLWDSTSGQLKFICAGHIDVVSRLLFSPDSEPSGVALATLATFGVRAAHALRSSLKARTVALELDRTRALLTVVGQAISELSLAHTLETAVARVGELLDADRLAVYLREDDRLYAAAGIGLAGPHVRLATRLLELTLGPFRSRGILVIPDVASDPRLAGVGDAAAETGIEAAIAIPLLAQAERNPPRAEPRADVTVDVLGAGTAASAGPRRRFRARHHRTYSLRHIPGRNTGGRLLFRQVSRAMSRISLRTRERPPTRGGPSFGLERIASRLGRRSSPPIMDATTAPSQLIRGLL